MRTDVGDIEAAAVVVATGHQHTPALPAWPGRDGYAGRLLHSSDYRNAAPFAGMRVLVAGTGNSGADIASSSRAPGARHVWVAMRRPPHIIPRQRFGVPAQVLGVGLRHAPAAAADPLVRLARRALVGDLRSLGLPAPSEGLLAHNRRTGAVPLLDVGFVAALRAGRFRLVAAVEAFAGAAVRLADGSIVSPDAVVACTGFGTGLGDLVGHLDVLDPIERPLVHGATGRPRVPGLWFTGFRTPDLGRPARAALRGASARPRDRIGLVPAFEQALDALAAETGFSGVVRVDGPAGVELGEGIRNGRSPPRDPKHGRHPVRDRERGQGPDGARGRQPDRGRAGSSSRPRRGRCSARICR